jgi:hypothetical protein
MKSKRRISDFVLLLFIAFAANLFAAGHKYSLILVEFGENGPLGGGQTQTLVRYHFSDGVVVSSETILTTRTLELRYDLGDNQIYDGRYVITSWGDVVDLTTGKILLKSKGELIGIDKESNAVIIRVERADDIGVYSFDLASHQYRLMQQPGLWAMRGAMSPDGRLVANAEDARIWLYRPDGKKSLLGNDFWREGTVYCNSFLSPTFLWIDDRHLLTQSGNGHLEIVDVEGGKEPLFTIPKSDSIPPPACGPELMRDNGGQIYYVAGDMDWRINLAKRSFEPYLWESAGNGFEMEYQSNDTAGRLIRYNGAEIGRWQRDIFRIVAAPGHIAISTGPPGALMGRGSDDVKVWSVDNGKWTTIGPVRAASIVGWLEE